MSTKKELIFSGVGGQGLLKCGDVLGKAAVEVGKYATMSVSYGTETRGTFSKSDVVIDEVPIDYPEVLEADIVICLHQIAYDRYAGKLGENAFLFYDESEVTPREIQEKQFGEDLKTLLEQEGLSLQNKNIITIGIVIGMTDLIDREVVANVLRQTFGNKEKVQKSAIRAYEMGLKIGERVAK